MLYKRLARSFGTTHCKVAVIGAGAGGHSVTSQLIKSKAVAGQEITVFDAKKEHHYQPAYTMVAGGVLGNLAQTKRKEEKYVVRTNAEMF